MELHKVSESSIKIMKKKQLWTEIVEIEKKADNTSWLVLHKNKYNEKKKTSYLGIWTKIVDIEKKAGNTSRLEAHWESQYHHYSLKINM